MGGLEGLQTALNDAFKVDYARTPDPQRSTTRSAAGPRRHAEGLPAGESPSPASTLAPLRAALNRAPSVRSVAQFQGILNVSPRVTALARRSDALQATRGAPVVQRAVVAIDGASDDDTSKAITRSCFANLTTRKRIPTDGGGRTPKGFPAGDARGATYGPGPANAAFAGLAAGADRGDVTPQESIYVLGHGDGVTVGGLDASTLAGRLAGSLARLPDVYVGVVKLVACYSGSLVMDGQRIIDPKTKAPIDKSYAASLADSLTASKTPTFQPAGAEGIAGIAWVDEITGQKTGLDVLGEKENVLNPAERLYTDPAKTKVWFEAMLEPVPEKRRERMEQVLGQQHGPGEESLPARHIGKTATRRFPTG